MVTYKDIEFENNPNAVSEEIQYKGDVYIKYAGHSCMTVYGMTEAQVLEMCNKFKDIEPRTGVVEIYSPANDKGRREYVNTIVLY